MLHALARLSTPRRDPSASSGRHRFRDSGRTPTVVRVDPWSFYPDLSESEIRADGDYYELHRMTKLGLAKLASQPGFDPPAIARVIDSGAQASQDANQDAQRVSAGSTESGSPRKRAT